MSQRFIAGAVKFISDGHVQMVPQLNALAEDEGDELVPVCYRIYTKKEHLPWKAGTMNVAWMHFGLSNFASQVLGLWYYITFFNNFDLSVRITYPVFATIIFVAQIYSTWAQYNVYRRVQNETMEYKVPNQTQYCALSIQTTETKRMRSTA